MPGANQNTTPQNLNKHIERSPYVPVMTRTGLEPVTN